MNIIEILKEINKKIAKTTGISKKFLNKDKKPFTASEIKNNMREYNINIRSYRYKRL